VDLRIDTPGVQRFLLRGTLDVADGRRPAVLSVHLFGRAGGEVRPGMALTLGPLEHGRFEIDQLMAADEAFVRIEAVDFAPALLGPHPVDGRVHALSVVLERPGELEVHAIGASGQAVPYTLVKATTKDAMGI